MKSLTRRRGTHTLGVIEVLDKAVGVIAYTAAVEVETECFRGTQLVFYHRRLKAFTLFSTLIVDDETTRVYLRTGRDRRWGGPLRLLDRALLDLHHRLNLTFVFQDLDALRGVRFRPGVLLPEEDAAFIAWHRHFRAVPRVAVPE